MAGQPGRSGGAREGAGRPPAEPTYLNFDRIYEDPLDFLKAVMNDSGSDAKLRVSAAQTLMPFFHAKKGEGGKKEAKATAAQTASKGKFAAAQAPRIAPPKH